MPATDEFDVVVIGAGPVGETAAGRCTDGGLSAAIVESRLVGGECSYWACIPSKTLVRPGDVIAAARRVPGAAEAVTGPIDAAAAFAQRDYMTAGWKDDGAIRWLDDKGVVLVRGRGRLAGERRVEVTAPGGDVRTLTARRAVVVATGSTAAVPPIDGLAAARPWTNIEITETHHVPPRLLILGGGPVGVEMAQAFARLGSQVTVIEGGPRLLAREEPFVGEEVAAAFEREGITVVTGAMVTAARRDGATVTLVLDDGAEHTGDEVLVAAGRRPKTMDLGLEAAGLAALEGKYLPVDDQMRVEGRDWLYAVGDCNGRVLLTHMGKYQARICGDVILGKDARATAAVSRVTFTDPQVSAVGLTEHEARATGRPVRVLRVGTGDVPGAEVEGDGVRGTSFLVVDDERRTVLGATFTGPDVQELLHSASVAIAGGTTVDQLGHAVPSFPTVSEVWLRLLEEFGV